MPKIPGVNHLHAVRALGKAGSAFSAPAHNVAKSPTRTPLRQSEGAT